jgi:spectinomycin phosphotransferase
MLEPAKVGIEALCTAVKAAYGLEAAGLAFLPIGADSAAWVYRLEAGTGEAYLLKLRQGRVNEAGLWAPRHLRDQGVARVVAPLAGRDGRLWYAVEGFALMLYPFLNARTGTSQGLTDRQWRAFGKTLRQVHQVEGALPPELRAVLPRETFVPQWRETLEAVAGRVAEDAGANPLTLALAAVWAEHRSEIEAVTARAEALGQAAREEAPGCVLCHADAHTWNVLVDEDEQIWLVDWDEAVLAPRERDLMFVIQGIGAGLVTPRQTELFFEGYGQTEVDARRLAYYRAAWAVNDLGAYGAQVCLQPEAGEVTRRAALEGFKSQFAPGAIVELALASSGWRAREQRDEQGSAGSL